MKKILLLIMMVLCISFAYAGTVTVSSTSNSITFTPTASFTAWGFEMNIPSGITMSSCSGVIVTSGVARYSTTESSGKTCSLSGTGTLTGSWVWGQTPNPSTSGTFSTVISGTTPCTPSWGTGNWGTCSASCTQTRTVLDSNNCGVTTGKPIDSQVCTGGNCNPSVPCTDSTWTPNVAANTICTTAYVTETSNCGTSRNNVLLGTKDCSSTPSGTCQFYETKQTDNTCKLNMTLIIGGIVGLIVLKMFM